MNILIIWVPTPLDWNAKIILSPMNLLSFPFSSFHPYYSPFIFFLPNIHHFFYLFHVTASIFNAISSFRSQIYIIYLCTRVISKIVLPYIVVIFKDIIFLGSLSKQTLDSCNWKIIFLKKGDFQCRCFYEMCDLNCAFSLLQERFLVNIVPLFFLFNVENTNIDMIILIFKKPCKLSSWVLVSNLICIYSVTMVIIQ